MGPSGAARPVAGWGVARRPNIWHHMKTARRQVLVQLSDDQVALLDTYAARHQRSRSSVIRDAIGRFLADDEEAEIDRQIIEGYRRVPEQPWEIAWTEASAREMIEEEPW